jgi:hypothetical protein
LRFGPNTWIIVNRQLLDTLALLAQRFLRHVISLFPDSDVLSKFVTEPVVTGTHRELIVRIQKLDTHKIAFAGFADLRCSSAQTVNLAFK